MRKERDLLTIQSSPTLTEKAEQLLLALIDANGGTLAPGAVAATLQDLVKRGVLAAHFEKSGHWANNKHVYVRVKEVKR